MPGSILIVGATGNTGQNAVRQLSAALEGSGTRLIALTRSTDSPAAQALAKLAGVQVEGKNWTEIDAAWLRERAVEKCFIAPFNSSSQFSDDSGFYLAAREAGVRYVVRVSTLVHYVKPDSPVFYGRAHWAAEELLGSAAFAGLGWTSLQPNFFGPMFLATAVEWVKNFRASGKQDTLNVILDEHAQAAVIDPADVGALGAALLLLDDAARAPHLGQRYVLAGPRDVSGRDVVRAVEGVVGETVESVSFRDVSWMPLVFERRLIPSASSALEWLWDGSSTRAGAGNSEAVVELAEPRGTLEETLKALVAQ